jgi:hypothetical protein
MYDFDYFIQQIIWNNFIIFVWFNTDAFTDYFYWTKKFKLTEYREYVEMNKRIAYPEFLFLKNPNFFTKLISCRPCFLFWTTIITSFYFGFSSFVFVYLLSYIIYKILLKYVY